jgi:hypothetical protein
MDREITLIKLSETYIKFDFEYTEINRKLIKDAYLEYTASQSRIFLKNINEEDLIISIEYEKGSLKTRIIVWGTSIYLVVANYGSFRSGIREMVNDSKDFSEFISHTITNDPQIDQNNIIRVQKRTGILGRLDEIFIQVDSLQRNINNLTPNQVQQQLAIIKQEIANISVVLNQNDKNAFLNALPANYSNNLPNPQDNKSQYLEHRYGLKPDENIEILQQ